MLFIDKKYQQKEASAQPGEVVAFWHIDDLKNYVEKLLDSGTTEYEKITESEDGFITASVIDPFGNILGIMNNPHYLEILTALKK